MLHDVLSVCGICFCLCLVVYVLFVCLCVCVISGELNYLEIRKGMGVLEKEFGEKLTLSARKFWGKADNNSDKTVDRDEFHTLLCEIAKC